MQHAVTVSPDGTQIIQAGPDAPRYAQCVWCGMTVELIHDELGDVWSYQHTSDDATFDCQ